MAAWPPPRMTKSFLVVRAALLRGVSATYVLRTSRSLAEMSWGEGGGG
jgi:hypothetical protein